MWLKLANFATETKNPQSTKKLNQIQTPTKKTG